MKKLSVLDCTLRDGGRIIDCNFDDSVIVGVGKQLHRAGIDIIELGFLRDNINFNGNSTFFSCIEDADKYVEKISGRADESIYVLFVDYGLYDVYKLKPVNGIGIRGIRFGFTQNDFRNHKDELIKAMNYIKKMGYLLFFQDVNTPGYENDELNDIIDIANNLKPVSFGIVDTYGSMYLDDFEKVWNAVDTRLDKNIAIDFHSHNNMQMSFALTQRLINLAIDRDIIIDATLNGMGKCAGNLNTELIVDFLSRKMDFNYDVDTILDAIDSYIYPIKKKCDWGYTVPAFIAGIYKSHPNNIIYLTEKYRLNNKDIKYIISGIEKEKRQRYDYDNIQRIYKEYSAGAIDDELCIEKLTSIFRGKNVLVMAPGSSIESCRREILQYINNYHPIVVSVNFLPKYCEADFYFYANTIYWEKISENVPRGKCIISSNVHMDTKGTYIVNYSSLIAEDSPLYDNSTIMLLNLLKTLEVAEIHLAGFDGLGEGNNYIDNSFPNAKAGLKNDEINLEITKLLVSFCHKTKDEIVLSFLTPSIYKEKMKEVGEGYNCD